MIAPILSRHDDVSVEGIRFIYKTGGPSPDHPRSEDEGFWDVLMALPEAVFKTYEKGITSRRMAPLFTHYMDSEQENELSKLMSIFLIISSRPAKWRETVEKYILSQHKHSVYLLAVVSMLRRQLRHGCHIKEDKADMIDLVGVGVARHKTGAKKPNRKLIEKASKAALADEWPA